MSVKVDVHIDRPATGILLAAAEAEADLIIMSTRGVHGIRRLAMGSVTTEVIHQSSRPIAVIPPEWRAATEAKTYRGEE
jgi:nucleotide-binding universal stress UspA family protein